MKNFLLDESGSISVGLSLIFPILVLFALFTEVRWQAHYIRIETQAILDFAVLGAAQTGIATEDVGGEYYCYIPYDEGDVTYSGTHVSKYLIEENLHVLPTVLQEDVQNMLNSNSIYGLHNYPVQQNGYMNLELQLNYRNPLNLLFNQYVFNIESTARCQPDI